MATRIGAAFSRISTSKLAEAKILGKMLVYDITKRQTFDHVARWIEELGENADSSIVVMLIGNKCYLAAVGKRAVSTEDALEFAEEQGLFFSEASALSGENVEIAFLSLLEPAVSTEDALEFAEEQGIFFSEPLALSGENVETALLSLLEPAVSTEDALEFTEEQELFFSEASALSSENVETAFLSLLEEIYDVMSRKALECGAARRVAYSGNEEGRQ